MDKDIAIVFDCGATNVRVVAMDTKGKIIAKSSYPNEVSRDSNFDSGLIWDIDILWSKLTKASKEVVSKIDISRIAGVTVTTFGVDGTFVDSKGELLYPVVSWQCRRSETMMEKLSEYISVEQVQTISGVAPQWFNTIYKLLWFKEHHPEVFDKAYRFLFISSLLIFKLCGVMKNDKTMVGTSMMADLSTANFSKEILDAIDVDIELFGEVADTSQVAGVVDLKGFNDSAIPLGVPVVFAGHDTQFAIFGSSAQLNQPVLSSGTWEILMGRYSIGSLGCVNSDITVELDAQKGVCNIGQNWLASAILEWFFNCFYSGLRGDELYALLQQEYESLAVGQDDMLFVNPDFYKANGTIEGLTISTKPAQIYRAILKSLSFRLRESLELLESVSATKTQSVICVGGGSKNRIWNQLRADILQLPIITIDQKETTVLGAALFVFQATKVIDSAEQYRSVLNYNREVVEPNILLKEQYDNEYREYLKKVKNV